MLRLLATFTVAASPYLLYKSVECFPETKNSLKHKLRHTLNWNTGGDVVHYKSTTGDVKMGLRCRICERVFEGDEDTSVPMDPQEQRSRRYHQQWYARWGPKDHTLYLKWLDNHKTSQST